MRDAVIAPIGTDADALCIDGFKIGFVIGEQLVVTFGFGNRFFKAFGGNGFH